jgi:hypothetical protein
VGLSGPLGSGLCLYRPPRSPVSPVMHIGFPRPSILVHFGFGARAPVDPLSARGVCVPFPRCSCVLTARYSCIFMARPHTLEGRAVRSQAKEKKHHLDHYSNFDFHSFPSHLHVPLALLWLRRCSCMVTSRYSCMFTARCSRVVTARYSRLASHPPLHALVARGVGGCFPLVHAPFP